MSRENIINKMKSFILSSLEKGESRSETKCYLISYIAGYEPDLTVGEFNDIFLDLYDDIFNEFYY